jgi:Zn-dependent protease
MPLAEMLQSGRFNIADFLTWVLALTVGITIHEFAHAYRADRAGDPTPRANGRVSLNPLDHYDPIGTTLILLFGFGWGKPVPVNRFLFRRPQRDDLMVSLWGPLSNLIAATVLALPVRLHVAGPWEGVLAAMVQLQIILAVFNLLPVYPLDGSHILSALLPPDKARRLDAMYHQYGPVLLLVVVMAGSTVVWPVVDMLRRILLGV